MDWVKTTARRHEKQLSFEIGAIYARGFTVSVMSTSVQQLDNQE